jgi:hypothetical protein
MQAKCSISFGSTMLLNIEENIGLNVSFSFSYLEGVFNSEGSFR